MSETRELRLVKLPYDYMGTEHPVHVNRDKVVFVDEKKSSTGRHLTVVHLLGPYTVCTTASLQETRNAILRGWF